MVHAGSEAPDFRLETHRGDLIQLSKLRGRPVVLYFYPKDNTPGCTLEAQQFQEHWGAFEKLGALVVGLSPDTLPSHCRFAEKYSLAFPLLADVDHAVAEAYGVWVEKHLYGRTYWGIQRSTFLIDARGTITRVWPKVKAAGHAQEVLEAVRALVKS
jgi:thioredoxin-dependent peroxiredoxin